MRPFFFIAGGVVLPSLFLCRELAADTIVLKNGKDLKGLVVEEHEDRVVLSTENGEIPILRRGIRNIDFDDPAQNFLSAGRAYEDKQRWGEALGYYEKAAELNPDLEDAKKAAVRVRNRLWSKAASGPLNEIETRQVLHETWEKGRFPAQGGAVRDSEELLEKGLGLRLAKQGDWVRIEEAVQKKDAAAAGLRKHDRLVAVDGESLRYLGKEAVVLKLTEPRYSAFTLEYHRDCRLPKTGFEKEFRDFGFEPRLGANGVLIGHLRPRSIASRAGLREGDLLVEVNGESMRYLPLKKLMAVLQKDASRTEAVLTVRRSAILTRK